MNTSENKENIKPDAPSKEAPREGVCKKFLHFLKVNMLAGLVVLLPLVVTIWLFKTIVITIDNMLLGFIPPSYQLNTLIEKMFGVHINFSIYGLGLVVGLVFLVVLGIFVRNIIGRTLLAWGESILGTIPGVRSVYYAIKQIIETVASSNSTSFRKVVLFEYPRKGIWAIGFVSSAVRGQAQALTEKKLINVFLPTTPNPTSGFFLMVPEEELTELNMTVEQGLKMIISAGIVNPENK